MEIDPKNSIFGAQEVKPSGMRNDREKLTILLSRSIGILLTV